MEGGSLSVGPEGYVKEGSENRHLSPCWETMEGGYCLSRDIERKVRFYFIRRPCLLGIL